ncbi:MAG: hypothetical protein FJY65_03500 [Calditrichaeota bacterium]|nr:hypothetical protein [Calditrichota bacterium]
MPLAYEIDGFAVEYWQRALSDKALWGRQADMEGIEMLLADAVATLQHSPRNAQRVKLDRLSPRKVLRISESKFTGVKTS